MVENTHRFEKKKKEKTKKEKRKALREMLEDVALILFVLIVVLVLQNYVIINAKIPSGSMETTIMTGDRVFGYRLAYKEESPQRGDIVIFKYPDNEEELFIKRVIGLPGEKVEIRDGLVYINDSSEPLSEPYLTVTPIGDFGPYQVPEGHYFMLGDNRNFSKDSRVWNHPYVAENKIVAKAVFRYYPFTKMGTIS